MEVADGVIYHKTEYRERRNHFAYFACSEPLAGFDTQRTAFLGPYRGWEAPLAVERGQMGGSLAHGWQPVGALHRDVVARCNHQGRPEPARTPVTPRRSAAA